MLRAARLLCLTLLAGCALGPQAREGMANYDFGLPRSDREANPRLQQDLVVAEVTAPAWMDNSGIYYRLAYQDATRPRAYALSHWVMARAAPAGEPDASARPRGAAGIQSRTRRSHAQCRGWRARADSGKRRCGRE